MLRSFLIVWLRRFANAARAAFVFRTTSNTLLWCRLLRYRTLLAFPWLILLRIRLKSSGPFQCTRRTVALHSKVSCKDATKRNPRIMRILFVYGSAVTGPVGQVGELPSSRRHKVSNLLGRWPTQRILREIHHRVNPATKTTATLSSNNKDYSNTVIKLEQNTPMEATTRVPCKKIQNAIKCGFRVNRRAMLFARENSRSFSFQDA